METALTKFGGMKNDKLFQQLVKSQEKDNIGSAPSQNDEGKQVEDSKENAEY